MLQAGMAASWLVHWQVGSGKFDDGGNHVTDSIPSGGKGVTKLVLLVLR